MLTIIPSVQGRREKAFEFNLSMDSESPDQGPSCQPLELPPGPQSPSDQSTPGEEKQLREKGETLASHCSANKTQVSGCIGTGEGRGLDSSHRAGMVQWGG